MIRNRTIRSLRYHVRRSVELAEKVAVELGGPWAQTLPADATRLAFSLAYYEADLDRRRVDAELLIAEQQSVEKSPYLVQEERHGLAD